MKLAEDKIELLHSYKHIPEIVLPQAKVVSERTGAFAGYIMNKTPGITFPELHENLPLSKLRKINYLTAWYLKIEDAIKKVNENDIIVPDIGTMYNIMINENKDVRLIDCDSWQVGPYNAFEISTLLGEQEQYEIRKYIDLKTKLFKDNLDKKSLALMYFVTVPGLELEGTIIREQRAFNWSTTQAIETLFHEMGLEDVDFQHKIWKMYQPNEDNDYIGEDVRRIAENYVLVFEKGNTALRKFKKI